MEGLFQSSHAQLNIMTIIQQLTGKWQFHQEGKKEWLPATVPGGVHTDLMANNLIPDPFVSDNEKRVKWVAESDWEYRTSFKCTKSIFSEEKVFLVCDGLDTLAEVFLNGHKLGCTDNMFRRYQWEIKSILNEKGSNNLLINFSSPVKYAAEKQSLRSLAGVLSGDSRWFTFAEVTLSIWLGLGTAASADWHLEGYTSGRAQFGAPRRGTYPSGS